MAVKCSSGSSSVSAVRLPEILNRFFFLPEDISIQEIKHCHLRVFQSIYMKFIYYISVEVKLRPQIFPVAVL